MKSCRDALDMLRAVGMADTCTERAMDRLLDACPGFRALMFECVLGDDSDGRADVSVRLEPPEMDGALRRLGGTAHQDWQSLFAAAPGRGWIELDAGPHEAPPSVFGAYFHSLHASRVRRLVAELGGTEEELPGENVRHIGVLHGRELREIRLVYAASDQGTPGWLPCVPDIPAGGLVPGDQWSVGVAAGGRWIPRVGLERSLRQSSAWPSIAARSGQRDLLDRWWDPGVGRRFSHVKWDFPAGRCKVYLEVQGR